MFAVKDLVDGFRNQQHPARKYHHYVTEFGKKAIKCKFCKHLAHHMVWKIFVRAVFLIL